MSLTSAYPLVIFSYQLVLENRSIFESYVSSILQLFGTLNPFRLLVSLLIQPILGIEFLSHYRESYPELKKIYGDEFELYSSDKITSVLGWLKTSMLSWKLLLFHARLVKQHQDQLITADESKTADIDVTGVKSFSSKKEGAEVGFNRKYRGKPCFQLSASFIGRVFVDAKLFAGHCNPKDFFKKSVKRIIALGFAIEVVRADSAYLTQENLLLLQKLSLGYAIGAPSTFNAVKEGKQLFKKLALKKHRSIVSVAKGVSVLDLGKVSIHGIDTRIVIVRRIQRRKNKKTGKWKIKTYFYAIATNLSYSAQKVYVFYHKRQCIESGFRELKDHYHLERLPVKNLKGNEFWIICKIFAMTLVKIFQANLLPKNLQSLMRATLIRRLFRKDVHYDNQKKAQIRPNSRFLWVLRRLFAKLEKIKNSSNPGKFCLAEEI